MNVCLPGWQGYSEVKHTRLSDDEIGRFIGTGSIKKQFPYSQTFDLKSFKGRVFSSSYTPKPTDDNYADFEKALEKLFKTYSENDSVSFEYSTTVYSGHLK